MPSIIKVALADDHDIVLNGVKEIIMDFDDFSVEIEAKDGFELYQKLLSAERLPDIVVMDISMPVWDGYETLSAIRKKWPDLKVLILTMHTHELAINKMFKIGANGYLLKSSPPEELEKAMTTILNSGIYFSPIVSNTLLHRLQTSTVTPSLSEKEIQFLRYCHTNLSYKEIADKMNTTERSALGYRDSLFLKLDVNSRTGLAICAIQMGLVRIE